MAAMVYEKATPGFLERLSGKLAAKLIVFSATRAMKRGDRHEVNHMLAAVIIGNTGKADFCKECATSNLDAEHSPHLAHETCILAGMDRTAMKTMIEALTAGELTRKDGSIIPRWYADPQTCP